MQATILRTILIVMLVIVAVRLVRLLLQLVHHVLMAFYFNNQLVLIAVALDSIRKMILIVEHATLHARLAQDQMLMIVIHVIHRPHCHIIRMGSV